MANKEHLDKLQEGVDVWNAWRAQNRDIRPNFCEANLIGVNLEGADLGGANFSGADLVGANLIRVYLRRADLIGVNLGGTNLSEANLSRADLIGANLVGADLSSANLIGVNLTRANLGGINLNMANLSEADLSRASLIGANLNSANLDGANLVGANLNEANLVRANFIRANLSRMNLSRADLTDARLFETIFANVDLTDVRSLESCVHQGPSTIDHRTLARSGQLPLSFLRGCGLPDTLIDYLPSLLNRPIQHYSCFISYSSKDEALAKRLHADLQDKGVRCWFAPEDLKIGDKLRVRIDEAIRTYEKLLLLLSKHSMASTWVENEVETAFDKENERGGKPVLFPIRLDTAVMESKIGWAAAIRRTRYVGDFSNWKNHDEYQKGLERLLRDLQIEKDAS